MGHNVSSNKVIVSREKNSDSADSKHRETSSNGINNVSSGADLELYGSDSVEPCFKRIKEYNVKVKEDGRLCDITGCCILPDGCCILTDYTNKRLKKLNLKKQVSFVNLPEQPTDVCCLGGNDNKLVVCGGSSLHFLSSKGSMKLSRSVTLDHVCNGLTIHGDNLFIVDDTSVFRYTCAGDQKRSLYTSSRSKFCHISPSVNGERLYITDERSGLITLDKSGKLLATFKHNDLKEAQGVCVDSEGNVLVSGFESDMVIKVDTSGKVELGTVIGNNGDISDPKCLCVDIKKSQLYVGQWNDKLAVFDMKK